MGDPKRADDFIPAALAALGVEADDALERANGRRWVDAVPPLAAPEPAGG